MTKTLHSVEAEALLYDRIGDGFAVVAVAMTAWAGWHLGGDSLFASFLIAALMGLVTYGLAQMIKPIDRFWRAGRYGAATAVAIVAGLFFFGEYNGHLMFHSGHRTANIEQANLQDIRFDDTQSQKQELAEKQKLLKDRLAKLENAAGWVSTKPSAAWKAEIANKEGDKLYARSRQCSSVTKADSRKFCDELTELRANLAVAEDHDSVAAMLKATETALLNTREKSADMHRGESIAAEGTKLFAQISTASLAPSATATAWASIGMGGYVALLSSIGAAFFKWLSASILAVGTAARRVKDAVVEANPLQPQIDELKAMLLQMAQGSQQAGKSPAAPVSVPANVEHRTEREVIVLPENEVRDRLAALGERYARAA